MDVISTQHLLGWGLSLDDYREMFDLNDGDLNKNILDFQPGPNTFNKELTELNVPVHSVDQLYAQGAVDIAETVAAQMNKLKQFIHQHETKFSWDKYANVDELLQARDNRIQEFLHDFPIGTTEGRYSQDLSQFTGQTKHFDLALVSHALFGENSDDINYHLTNINQLIHLADEVRIFPLLDHNSEISVLVGPVSLALQQQNFGIEIREVQFHLQDKANAMLRIWPLECII